MTIRDGAWHDRMYNNRELVPEHGVHLARWAGLSARALAESDCETDLRYGPGEAETLDVFRPPGPGAPVLVFIHGGYWRALDKRDHAFVGPAFTRDGACVVVPNYTLCPATTVSGIVMEMVRALAWTWRNISRFGGDPSRITVAGHSAGGHLAAMMLACLWPRHEAGLPPGLARNALSISGLHDLEPIMHTPFLQPSLRLTGEEVRRASPARLPAPAAGTLYAVFGANESEEFGRQARLMRQAWGAERVPVCESLPGLHHFSVLEALVEPSHRLHQLALDLLRAE
jgi:arylformamidase